VGVAEAEKPNDVLAAAAFQRALRTMLLQLSEHDPDRVIIHQLIVAAEPAGAAAGTHDVGASQQAAASLRTGVNPSSSTQQARDLRAQEVSYRVEIQKKLVLAASCLVLALAALALGWHFARVNAAVLVATGITLCVLFVVSVMAGEALAESLVVPPIIAMWAGTELVLLMTLPALRSKRAVA
jgi:lipopolysaccharide export LptBFGC system permease protein LptF